MEKFSPEKLIGKSIWFQPDDKKVNPVIIEVLSLKKIIECREFHKGRCDLVVYDTSYGELSIQYRDVNNLIDVGFSNGSKFCNYEYRIVDEIDR